MRVFWCSVFDVWLYIPIFTSLRQAVESRTSGAVLFATRVLVVAGPIWRIAVVVATDVVIVVNVVCRPSAAFVRPRHVHLLLLLLDARRRLRVTVRRHHRIVVVVRQRGGRIVERVLQMSNVGDGDPVRTTSLAFCVCVRARVRVWWWCLSANLLQALDLRVLLSGWL